VAVGAEHHLAAVVPDLVGFLLDDQQFRPAVGIDPTAVVTHQVGDQDVVVVPQRVVQEHPGVVREAWVQGDAEQPLLDAVGVDDPGQVGVRLVSHRATRHDLDDPAAFHHQQATVGQRGCVNGVGQPIGHQFQPQPLQGREWLGLRFILGLRLGLSRFGGRIRGRRVNDVRIGGQRAFVRVQPGGGTAEQGHGHDDCEVGPGDSPHVDSLSASNDHVAPSCHSHARMWGARTSRRPSSPRSCRV
jgi:hypothetical protein